MSRISNVASNHVTIEPSVLYFGTPIVLIVSETADDQHNITPMSSIWALGKRVVLGLSTASQGAENLLNSGTCTLNFPSADQWENVEKIARKTGRFPVPDYKVQSGYSYSADKFSLGGFTRIASDIVKVPRIRECPLQFEAKVSEKMTKMPRDILSNADHIIVELDVLRVHAESDIVVPGTHHIDTRQWNPLFYVFRHYFGYAQDLGKNFRSEI